MASVHHGGLEYNLHNLYGFGEALATKNPLEQVRERRALVISRSTFPGTGFTASHSFPFLSYSAVSTHHKLTTVNTTQTGHIVGRWLGDNMSTWQSMRESIAGILTMSMLGMALVGADICGFGG